MAHAERARSRNGGERPAIRMLDDGAERAPYVVAEIGAEPLTLIFVPGREPAQLRVGVWMEA
ncbi:MAG TPA: hypothetical protein VFF06_32455 [Polyangia bacterium]|nr:hypothetical protein [Polyangia bacterium]